MADVEYDVTKKVAGRVNVYNKFIQEYCSRSPVTRSMDLPDETDHPGNVYDRLCVSLVRLEDTRDPEVAMYLESASGSRRQTCITADGPVSVANGQKPKKNVGCDRVILEQRQNLSFNGNTRRWECELCDKQFRKKSGLTVHVLTHNENKEYVCVICRKTFICKPYLKRHLLTHSDEKPHECDICQKTFRERSGLQKHMLVHTAERPHACDICRNTFKNKYALNKHISRHTRDKEIGSDVCDESITKKPKPGGQEIFISESTDGSERVTFKRELDYSSY